jgi:dTMP kinase
MIKRGRFLVVEGLEGAGKSTALHYLHDRLQSQGIQVITTREPGGTVVGETVRHLLKHTDQEPMDPRAELLLFYAARVQLLETVIKPALNQGTWVLADRCELSSFAYQGGGRGIQPEILKQLSALCVGDTQPDLLFYLDISPEIGLQRAVTRGKLDRIEQESLAFFQAVHARYQAYLPTYLSTVVIDASQPLIQVQADLEQSLRHYLVSQHDLA